jgi:hypothetical protein
LLTYGTVQGLVITNFFLNDLTALVSLDLPTADVPQSPSHIPQLVGLLWMTVTLNILYKKIIKQKLSILQKQKKIKVELSKLINVTQF